MISKNKSDTPVYFAAIDLGSRNCRLLLAKKTEGGIEILEATSRFVCLAEQITRTNKLSFEAMERAVEALASFQKKLKHYPNMTTLAVTTAASRIAENSELFLARVKEELNLDLHVISSKEEAHFATLGCAELMAPDKDFAIIFDIGGGSTEVIFADITTPGFPKPIDSISMNKGVVSIAEELVCFTFEKYSDTINSVHEKTLDFVDKHNIQRLIDEDKIQLIGTSGTTTTISALHQNLKFYDREKVDGSIMKPDDIERVIKHVQLMSTEERLLHPCIGQARDDLILGGLAIFEGIYKTFPNMSVMATDRGVRDGIIHALANPERFQNTNIPAEKEGTT